MATSKRFFPMYYCLALLWSVVLVGIPLTVHAIPQSPYLVQDINTKPTGEGSSPSRLTNVNGTLFFTAFGTTYAGELWKSDGTEAGTLRLANPDPGPNTAQRIESLTPLGTTVFFVAIQSDVGAELWKTDGTNAGTALVKDINPSTDSSFPYHLTVAGGTLYFIANDGTHGAEWWKSDGTAAGTVRLTDIGPGAASLEVDSVAAVGDTLFFIARTENSGRALWKSDGTAEGTVPIQVIHPGPAQTSVEEMVAVGNTLFFVADDGVHGNELWKSDGSSAGTMLVKDVNPTPDTTLLFPTVVGNLLYFVTDDGTTGRELWKSDGTQAGTVLVKDINPGGASAIGAMPEMAAVGTTLFFSADDGSSGRELWKTNGTAAGTVRVKNINPGSGNASPGSLQQVGTMLFFAANNGTTGRELWKSTGTATGTKLVKDIWPGDHHSAISWPTAVGNTLFFVANDGRTGEELWQSDGTADGTRRVKDIIGAGTSLHDRSEMTAWDNTLYFSADDGQVGAELWRSNGTAAGTYLVTDIYADALPSEPVGMRVVANQLLFFANDTLGHELWRSDGTAGGTTLVKDIAPGVFNPVDPDHLELAVASNLLFFAADDGQTGQELWRSDGTTAGTNLVRDLAPGAAYSYPSDFAVLNNTLYFSAFDGGAKGVWKSDGTAAGTELIHLAGAERTIRSLTATGNLLFFLVARTDGRDELWRTDGTSAGTVAIGESLPAIDNLILYNFTAVGNRLFFMVKDPNGGSALWKSDGTAESTVEVRAIAAAPADAGGEETFAVNDTLFFTVYYENDDNELWKSDGTTAGTVQVSEAVIPVSGRFSTSATVGDMLYFVGEDATHGIELWQSDGTAAGTTVYDIFPGQDQSFPTLLTATSDMLYFYAYGDNETGYELWALPLTETPPPPTTTEQTILLSTTGNGKIGSLAYRDEDILAYYTVSRQWELYLDGSDIGLGNTDIDAFALLPNGHLLLSIDKDFNLANFGKVDDSDILEFSPTSLGDTTAGTFGLYFDGSDVELTTGGEDIDGIDFGVQGKLRLSVTGGFKALGLKAGDEDLIRFRADSLGENTTGSFNILFDGSDVALTTAKEDVRDSWTAPNDDIYFVTYGNFSVSDLRGDNNDIIVCTPTSLGEDTSCTFRLFWDGGAAGLGRNRIDGLHLAELAPLVTAAANDAVAPLEDTIYFDGDDADEPDEYDGDEDDRGEYDKDEEIDPLPPSLEQTQHIYLPFVAR